MNINVLHVQIFLFDCPGAKPSPLQRPLDDLADRLRNEMRYGRGAGRGANCAGPDWRLGECFPTLSHTKLTHPFFRKATPMMSEHYFLRKDPYSAVIDVTPAIADAWLCKCNSHNRKLVDGHVDRLVREMKAGRWRLTHQGIAFSSNRVLLDGQHRLWAVFLSGVTVPMRVFFNESPQSLEAIDAVHARSNDQIITLAGGVGEVGRKELATLRAMVTGLDSYMRMTAGEEAELLASYHEGLIFSHQVLPAARFRGVATAITRAVLARAFYSAELGSLRHFADVLRTGVADGTRDQPITLLLRFLVDAALGVRGRPETREKYGKVERALQAFLSGEQLGRLFASSAELFPLPDSESNVAA